MAANENSTIAAASSAAAVDAQAPEPVSWGDPARLRILGKRFPRVEGPDKVTGRAKYTYDIVLPGMLYGRIVRSRYAAARIASDADVDTTDAEKIPGVKAIFKFVPPGGVNLRYAGEEIAAVAATTPEIADDAVYAIQRKIKYQPLPFVVDPDKAAAPNAPRVRSEMANVVPMAEGKPTVERGNVDEAFARAAVVIEGTYEAQTRLHCCLETHGHVCKWDGNQLTVWASTQNVTGLAGEFSNRLNTQARVICEHMGGGFGSKFGMGSEGVACAQLARLANAPVKLLLTREDEQLINNRSPGIRSRIKLGAAQDGTLLVSEVRTSAPGGTAGNVGHPLREGYYIVQPQAVRAYSETVLGHTAGGTALRAPMHPQASWCWESALDDLAYKLNMDPLELRRKNHNDPVRRAEWDRGAHLIGWDRRNKIPGTGRGVLKRGIGMASAQWGGGGRPFSAVDIVVGQDGSVTGMIGSQDLGTGTRTYLAAIIAEELGLDIKDVTPRIGDSAFPPSVGSGGSVTCPCVTPCIKMAAVDAKNKLLSIAAKHPNLGVPPEQATTMLEFVHPARIQVKGNAQKSITFKQACALLPPTGLKAHGEFNPALAQSGVAGCCFAEVEVDTETGKVRPVKIVSIQDCGFVVNRLQAETQVVGGIIQGIAQALLEYRQMDNLTGRMLNPNLEEYKLTHSMEVPEIVVEIFDNPVGKVSGIGEPPVIPVAGAIGNAVFNAIGVRVPDAPIHPDKVVRALAQRRGGVA